MRLAFLLCCLLFTTAAEIMSAPRRPAVAADPSGSPVFDELRRKAVKLDCPLVIHLTGTSWCPNCVAFTKKHMETPSFRQAEGKKFIVWSVDTKLVPGKRPGSSTFAYIPEEAGKVIGCLDSKTAPYLVLGPPAIVIIDPASGQMLDHFTGAGRFQEKGIALEEYIVSLDKCPKKAATKKQKPSRSNPASNAEQGRLQTTPKKLGKKIRSNQQLDPGN